MSNIDAMPVANVWISVYDRLPDEKQVVVVSDGIHTWDVGQFNGLCYDPRKDAPRRDRWNWRKNVSKPVLWWMPKDTALPEPPKGDYDA